MSDWRYYATRLKGDGTETIIHNELPLTGVSITDTLSGPQGFSATIAPELASLIADDGQPIFDPWSTAIYAEKDGAIRGGAILDEMVAHGDGSLELSCVGFAGYPKDMPYMGDYSGIGVDPLDVFRLIWTHLQSQPRGNLGVVVDSLKSGVKIGKKAVKVELTTAQGQDVTFDAGPVMMSWYKSYDLMREIEDLIKACPFDYREVHSWAGTGNTISHRIQLGYPVIGRRRADLRFMVGENVFLTPDVTFPGDQYASEILALGTGEGAKMRKASVARPHETRLRRVAVITDKRADTNGKAAHAASLEIKKRHGRPEINEVKVLDHAHARLGSFDVGDEVFVQTPQGWQGDLGFWARIISYTITPDNETVATLDLVTAERI